MKRRKHVSLSEKVLNRKTDRRNWLISIAAYSLVSILTFSFIGLYLHEFHEEHSLRRDFIRHIDRSLTPSWAEFGMLALEGGRQEFSGVRNEDGVPGSVIIDGEIWTIQQVNHFNDNLPIKNKKNFPGYAGQTYCTKNVIVYIKHDDPIVLRQTIWHEIMHAGGCLHGGDEYWNSINPTKDEHEGVKHLGDFLAVFTYENPKFIEWLGRS